MGAETLLWSVVAAALVALGGALGVLAVTRARPGLLTGGDTPNRSPAPTGDSAPGSAEVSSELDRVRAAVAELRSEGARHHGDLVARLEATVRSSRALEASARSLREALADPGARGQWGERAAVDLLRASGFVEGVSFHRHHRTEAGTVPDITFPLPGGRVLHMEVKFPLANGLRAVSVDDDEQRRAAIERFLTDVRDRIRELAGRGYVDPATTVDWVLLFLPNESLHGFIHDHDPDLIDWALGRRVVLCSPFSLFAVLAVVRQAAEQYQLQAASDEVLARLGAFGREWEAYCGEVDRVARAQATLNRRLDELTGPRRRQLQRQVDGARELAEHRGIESEAPQRGAGPPEAGSPEAGPPEAGAATVAELARHRRVDLPP